MDYKTYVTVEIKHDDLETLKITIKEVEEIMQYMTNLKRSFSYSVGRTEKAGKTFYTTEGNK